MKTSEELVSELADAVVEVIGTNRTYDWIPWGGECDDEYEAQCDGASYEES